MDYKTIIELIDKYGFWTGIGIVVITLLFALAKVDSVVSIFHKGYLAVKKFFSRNEYEKNSKVTFKDSDIINHEIFNYIDFWLYSSIPTLKFKTEYRTAIFRKYLTIYFNQYKDSLYVFVHDGRYKDMDNATLKATLYSLFNDIVSKYESAMREAELPNPVISKMKMKNNETYTLLLELTNSVCDNHFYNTEKNMLKMFTILNILNATLEYTINVSSEVCDNINGELSGKEYGGFKEPVKEYTHSSLLDITEVKNDFIHIYIDSDGILVTKILDDIILDEQSINNFLALNKTINGDIKRLILIDASSDWNITDKAKRILMLNDDIAMSIARAVIIKSESKRSLFLTHLKDDVPLKVFTELNDAKAWLLTFK